MGRPTIGRRRDGDFRIADTFTASLARLTGDDAKTTAFDSSANSAHVGLDARCSGGFDASYLGLLLFCKSG